MIILGEYTFSPGVNVATLLFCHIIEPSPFNLKAALSDIKSSLTRLSISLGKVFLAAVRIGAAFSPSERVGTKSKPLRVPTCSPSTKTVPSNFTIASKLFCSFNVLVSITIRLSTNL